HEGEQAPRDRRWLHRRTQHRRDTRRPVDHLHRDRNGRGNLARDVRGEIRVRLAARVTLGPYTIVGPIGAGGMGEVYRARDSRLERDVAIKVLAPALAADAEFRGRFDREARTIAALSHPNIAAVYGMVDGAGQENGSGAALVMELVEGESLDERIRRSGKLPVR